MGLPSINITFQTLGITAVRRSQKGVVALILRDSMCRGGYVITSVNELPDGLSEENREQIRLAFTGYVNPPRKVLAYVVSGEGEDFEDALSYFSLQQFDYLAGPPDITAQEAAQAVSWVKSERLADHMVKAVLPAVKADCEAVVNFTGSELSSGGKSYSAQQYCSRVAGLIAGTPMTISCTYAPLPELDSIKRLPKETLDAAIDAGEFVFLHDGEKVKAARGVNSLTTTTQDKGSAFKKIKVVEAMDMIKNDIRMTAQDGYIGKYANSYDNKCLLMTAIKGYFEELERSGILAAGKSAVEIDLDAQEGYLKANGTDTTKLSVQEIKEANTGSNVFLKASLSILDAIEDIDLSITI